MKRTIAANYLLHRGKFIANPIVEFTEDGEILSVEFGNKGGDDGADKVEGILFAGMVNAHAHLELSHFEGLIEPSRGFAHFAAEMNRLRGEFAQLEDAQKIIQSGIEKVDLQMQNEGVVAVCDIANGLDATKIKGASSIYYHTFVEQFGLGKTEGDSLPDLDGFGANSSYTPHSIYSLQSGFFQRVVDASHDEILSIHFMESPGESALFNGKGEMYDRFVNEMGFDLDFLHFGSPARRLIAQVPPHKKVLLVHNCCVSEQDIEMILEHFETAPTWVVCPCSNRFISGLTPPVELLQNYGAQIAIGTDSLASNGKISMLEEIRQMPQIDLATRLDWATRGGAKAIGKQGELGEVKVGAKCGLNLLQGVDLDSMELTKSSRIRRII